MNKGIISIIIVIVIAAIVGSAYLVTFSEKTNGGENQNTDIANSVSSGPITILQYEHKLAENVFMHIRGLGPNEKGNIRFFTPEGVLYQTIAYDGSIKQDFNQYFKPETSRILKICTPEEIIGEWTVSFDNNVYPPLKFKVLEEPLRGGEEDIGTVC